MTIQVSDQLKEAAQRVHRGHEETVPVRTLLSWFGAERRGYWKVREIRKALTKLKLKTEPDFEGAWIGADITLVPRNKVAPAEGSAVGEAATEELLSVEKSAVREAIPVPGKVGDPVNRIERLASANQPPTSVPPDATVQEAVTIMLLNDWAQLPVMTSDREVKGIFSWKSLVLLCYKRTIRCRIVSWAKRLRQAHRENALRHISRAWRKPQGTLTETSP